MNKRTPAAEPPPGVGKKSLPSPFAPDAYVGTGQASPEADRAPSAAEPKRSFFRGVAVGLAIMIPIWTWIIIRLTQGRFPFHR